MKNFFMKRLISFITLLLTLAMTVSVLSSCGIIGNLIDSVIPAMVGTKEEILTEIDATLTGGGKAYDEVEEYLHLWSLPRYDRVKFGYFELCFNQLYNLEGGLPEVLTHAADTAKLFVEHYYDTVNHDDKTAVTDALLYCYVELVGDPYSVYRPPVEADEFTDEMSGKFGGIGVMVEYNHTEETIMVNTVYPESPAEAAGMKVGDYIYAIDGKTVEEIGYLNAVYHIRGEIGTTVDITVVRGGEFVTVTATRAEVEEINVESDFDPETGIAYVSIVSFKENTFPQFQAAVDELMALDPKGFIFDLRNNPGGYVDSVCDVVSYIVPTGHTILSYQYKGREEVMRKSYDQNGEDHVIDLPMTVICNEYTASSGEIFTSAIRDYRDEGILNATIVGTNTFGKGIMQATFPYSDQSTVTLTVSYFNPPCGVNYHGIGIAPDVIVNPIAGEDIQLLTAYEELIELINNK